MLSELANKLSELIEEDLPNDTVVRKEEEVYQEEEMNEMDQIRKKLRTFTRAIPSFVMASKNPDSITLDNIEETVSDEDFQTLFTENDSTPFTKDDFRMIRGPWTNPETGEKFEGFFDRYTFNAAIREFEEKRKEVADYLLPGAKEDIFSYIRPLKTNQIFTPRRIVNQMLDTLEENVPGIFDNPDATFADFYVKSGLYLTEIAKRLNRGLEDIIPDRTERIRHIFEKQLYGFAPTKIIYDIAHKYIYGLYSDIDDNNFKQLDLTDKFKKGEILDMRFTAVIGNPPYQETKGGTKNIDIWPAFVFSSVKMAENVCLIHPGRWLIPKKQMKPTHDEILKSGLYTFNYYSNSTDIFPNVGIDGGVTITLFKKDYDGDIKYFNSGVDSGIFRDGEMFFSNQYEEEAYKKIHDAIQGKETMLDRIIGNIGSLGGSEFGYHKHTQIDQLKDSSAGMKNPVSIWANSGFGKGTRFSWHYIEKDILEGYPKELFETRKVMIDKKGHSLGSGSGNIINNIPQIVDKNTTASGDVLFVIPENDTDEDLKQIKSLFISKTARFLMSITQKDLYARGFENIPDYTLFKQMLKGQQFTDKFFYETFNFSQELIDHIEACVSEKVEA